MKQWQLKCWTPNCQIPHPLQGLKIQNTFSWKPNEKYKKNKKYKNSNVSSPGRGSDKRIHTKHTASGREGSQHHQSCKVIIVITFLIIVSFVSTIIFYCHGHNFEITILQKQFFRSGSTSSGMRRTGGLRSADLWQSTTSVHTVKPSNSNVTRTTRTSALTASPRRNLWPRL